MYREMAKENDSPILRTKNLSCRSRIRIGNNYIHHKMRKDGV